MPGLTFTRRRGQSFTLNTTADGPITVTIIETDRGKSRVNIVAPLSVSIARDDCRRTEPRPNGDDDRPPLGLAERPDGA